MEIKLGLFLLLCFSFLGGVGEEGSLVFGKKLIKTCYYKGMNHFIREISIFFLNRDTFLTVEFDFNEIV